MIDAACAMAATEIRHRARLVKEYGVAPPVLADETRLAQVFIILLVNAAQALEVGDDVRELGVEVGVLEQGLDAVDVDAVGLELDHAHVGAAVAQVQQRAVVGRRLDDHRVAGADQQLEQERVGLHRAVGDEHLVGLDAVLLGDPVAQRDVADRSAVGERAARIVRERALRGLLEALLIDDVEGRRPAGEGDRVGHAPRIRESCPTGHCHQGMRGHSVTFQMKDGRSQPKGTRDEHSP